MPSFFHAEFLVRGYAKRMRFILVTLGLAASTAFLLGCSSSEGAPADDSIGNDGGEGGVREEAGPVEDAKEASTPDETEFPTDTSVESVQAFLAAFSTPAAAWMSESEAPREPISSVSPHERVRVHVNQTLVASIQAGNGASIDAPPHQPRSMAVKELYDESDALVGQAAILWSGEDTVLYYCHGPAGRCINGEGAFAEDDPLYSDDDRSGCSFCHGGLIFSVTQETLASD